MKAQKSMAIALSLIVATVTAVPLKANSQEASNSNQQSGQEQIEKATQTNSCPFWVAGQCYG